jgi:O-methyltransferase
VYRELFGREPESDEVIAQHMANNDDVFSLIREAMKNDDEFVQRIFTLAAGSKPSETNERVYQTIVTTASYAPWHLDSEFMNIYVSVSGHTLVDLYRCWNLWHLVGQVAKSAGPHDHFVEIGVWRGGTGILMARAMASHGLGRPIYLCDTFQGVTKTGANDPHYRGGEHADTSVDVVLSLAKALGLRSANYEIFTGVFPEQMPSKLQAGNFAFAHIDVDAYQSARDCFAAIWPRMIPGGVVVFDDYGFIHTSGVTKLVDEHMGVVDGMCMYNLTGQAVFVKLSHMR